MAEEVKIVDVAGGPAAEATLQEILKLMKQRGGGGGGGTGSAAKAQELYTTAVTRGTTVQQKNTKEVKNTSDALGTFASGLTSVIGGAFSALGSVLGATTGLVTNFGGAVANATQVGDLLKAIPVFGSLLSQASGYFDSSVDTFRALSENGASFGNNLLEMRSAAAAAGLSMNQFAEVIGSNSSSMNLLGGTTSEGAKRFGEISRTLRSTNAGLTQLGFTQESINEGLIEYMESQALAGQLRGRSDRDLAAGAQNYMMELDKLSRATGKSRKELQNAITTNSQAAEVMAMRARLSGDALTNFDANMAHVSTMLPGFNNVFRDLSDGVAQSDFAAQLATAVPGFADLAEANRTGRISQEEFNQRMGELSPQIAGFITSMSPEQIQSLRAQGYGEMLDSVHEMQTYSQRTINMQKAAAEQARKDAMAKPFTDFAQRIQDIRSKIEEALIKSGVMETLGTVLGSLSNVIQETVEGFTKHFIGVATDDGFKQGVGSFKDKIVEMGQKAEQFVRYLKTDEFKLKVDNFIAAIKTAWANISAFGKDISEFGFVGAISKMLGGDGTETIGDMVKRKIGEGLQSLWDNAGLATKIGAGLIALFTGAKIIGALTGGIGSLFGGLFGRGGGSGGGIQGPEGSGRAGKGVGDFVGNVGGGVLSGVARGLAAFGNPQVAIGGAVLAGVILVIGAAVAGATWLVGSALPSFSEGMKSFEGLDGTKLEAAGKGMLAVAGGMAAFGAGSAVAGLGNLVGSISEGIAGLFGAEDPMEKIKKFQEYNLDEAKITGNANAVMAFSAALAAQGAGGAASGAGAAVGAIGNAIAGFFGGETGIPYDDIIAFQAYSFDTAKVQANAAAMVAFNNALTSSAGANATSGVGNAVGAIGNAISSFFGGDTPFDQVKDFGAMDINAEGVATNAGAMVAMANALSAFNGGEAGSIEIPGSTVSSLQRLSDMGNAAGLGTLATNLQAMASVTGLSTNVTTLNSLDADNVRTYNTAMEDLVETLGELNKVLAEDNKGILGGGTGVSAASMIESGALGGGSGTGSSEGIDRLNTLVAQLLILTAEGNTNTRNTVRAISGNLQLGV